MIKIIKNTMVDPIQKECDICKSLFEYNYQDIQRKEESGIFGITLIKRFIVCPVCKSEIEVKYEKVIEETKNEENTPDN